MTWKIILFLTYNDLCRSFWRLKLQSQVNSLSKVMAAAWLLHEQQQCCLFLPSKTSFAMNINALHPWPFKHHWHTSMESYLYSNHYVALDADDSHAGAPVFLFKKRCSLHSCEYFHTAFPTWQLKYWPFLIMTIVLFYNVNVVCRLWADVRWSDSSCSDPLLT